MSDLIGLPIGAAIGAAICATIVLVERHRAPLTLETWRTMSKWRKRRVIRGLAGRYNFGCGS